MSANIDSMKIQREIVDCPKCDGAGKIGVIVPESLRKKRLAAGLGLRELARRADLSAAYLSDIEHGRRNCTEGIERIYSKL